MKRQRRVLIQHTRELKGTRTYWDWFNNQPIGPDEEKEEHVLANPDVLPFNDPKQAHIEELEAVLIAIDRGAEKVLTKVEKKSFQLVVREGKSLREAALEIGISFQAVDQAVKRAAVKIRKLSLTNMP